MPLFCDKCGYQNSDTAKFCKGCGAEVIPTRADGTLMPGVMLDKRYEIKRSVKSGGMGSVYEALDHRFQKTPCAVKEMLSSAANSDQQQYMIDRFSKEAKLLHDLRHANLPVVKDYFVESGRYYLVMDYIEGDDLDTIMKNYGREGVPEQPVIEWTKEILDALIYLHNQSPPVIYRDLKPGNVMLKRSDKKIMLIDFGIARSLEGDNTMTVIGTPVYAPEELLAGKAEPRTDLYSLGATMHALLTGIVPQKPFEFRPVRDFKQEVSKELEAIVMKALSRYPHERFESAKKMKEALEKISLKNPETSEPTVAVTQISQAEATIQAGTLKAESPVTSAPTIPSEIPVTQQTIPSQEIIPPAPAIQAPSHQPVLEQTPISSEKTGKRNLLSLTIIVTAIITLVIFLFFRDSSGEFYKKGLKLNQEGKYKEAIESFNKALSAKPDFKEALSGKTEALKNYGDELCKEKKYEEGLDCYEEGLAIDNKNSALLDGKKKSLKDYASDLVKEEKYEKAIEYYEKLKNIDREEGLEGKKGTFKAQGDSFVKQEKYDMAIASYNKATDLDSDYQEAWIYKGTAYGKKKEFDKAMESIDKALTINPENGQAWNNKGIIYIQKKDPDEALTCFDKAIKYRSDYSEPWNNKGLIFAGRGDYDEAIICYDRALDIDSKYTKAWNNKGNALYNKGHFGEAVKCYDKALAIDPAFEIARENREKALKASGK